jgi:hypothetical protein
LPNTSRFRTGTPYRLLKRLAQHRARKCAIRADGRNVDAFALEPRFRGAVDSGAALSGLDVNRPVDGIQFGQIRQTPLMELHRRHRPDR